MPDENLPVLIVGGGPVGLSTSLFLARLGVSSLLVERHATTSVHPRARGINYRTMEILREVGLEEAVRSAGAVLANNRFSLVVDTLAGREMRRLGGLEEDEESRQRLQRLTPVSWCFCAQNELEPILLAATQELGSEVRFGTELVSFVQDKTGVTADLHELATGKHYSVRASYLVAADGASSPVRHHLDISLKGRGTLAYYVGIYFRADLSQLVQGREFIMCFVQNPDAHGTLSSVNNKDLWVLNVEYQVEDGTTSADFTPDRCVELVRKAIGLPQLEVELLSVLPWEAAGYIADSYQVGRVFLAGDAVHVMPPSGALGLNTGFQDGQNLAWKLAAVIKGQADAALLASYEAERRPVGQIIVEQACLRLDFRAARGKPSNATSEDSQSRLLDDLVLIFGYHYNSQAVIADLHFHSANSPFPTDQVDLSGQPGSRSPHLWLERAGQRISSLDLFGTRFVLLIGATAKGWAQIARNVATQLKLDLDIYQIGNFGEADLKELDVSWHTAYGVKPDGAVLVRPDGFIGWRSPNSSHFSQPTFEEALSKILGYVPKLAKAD